ncbi:Thiamine biosynthesis lipoprotein ApbE precursor [Roseovarius albus]|uniref:FAD:protein FMN transferase n=1 Tax=Roseovarius albus TaxID=1247867 RepID=A0A1X7A1F6_9RHOB|nr:FAD:protein FMN transferase [Roseovarius albus]SLN67541.1 Thiamine biosynthesis lipoprotein ApbE precursor [Roseovarius albus]
MKRLVAIFALLALTACWGEGEAEVLRLSGETMGTTYNITAVGEELDEEAIATAVVDALAMVNASMSNWDPESEVSKFSALKTLDAIPVSSGLARLMAVANEVNDQSEGRFDVTLDPLISLWGFGPRKPEDPVPSDEEITQAWLQVGQGHLLTLDAEAQTLTKSHPDVSLNLSAIAKGFGIDAVATALQAQGLENYMVEIGGDLVAEGRNPKGEPWRIGVEKPQLGAQSVQVVVPLLGQGLATSGDYRNFFEHEVQRYSHIIDPTTGRPITHATTSVTVIADTAMLADAWATAMLVLGAEAGLELAEAHKLAVFFISRDVSLGEDAYITAQSSAFHALLQAQTD